jgi:hypothetical protein
MPYATTQDVTDRYEGTADPARVDLYLADAERLLLRAVPDLPARVTAGDVDVELIAMIEAQAVIRHLRNPAGYTSESDGDYSYSRGSAAASAAGRILFLPDELALLRPTATPPASGWGTVRTVLPPDRAGSWYRP